VSMSWCRVVVFLHFACRSRGEKTGKEVAIHAEAK